MAVQLRLATGVCVGNALIAGCPQTVLQTARHELMKKLCVSRGQAVSGVQHRIDE